MRGYTKEQQRDLSVYGVTIVGPDGKRVPPEEYYKDLGPKEKDRPAIALEKKHSSLRHPQLN